MTEAYSLKLPHSCDLCPRKCGVDRAAGQAGFCGAGVLTRVAKACLHFGEEPCISGTAGSGAVFFAGCTMRCAFCQNHEISQGSRKWPEVDGPWLAGIFARLGARGPHNLNLVTPSHYLLQIAFAISRLPARPTVIWNSSGYENAEWLRVLEGTVDVYLPDLKYCDDSLAARYSAAPGYFASATRAIEEMWRQVGRPVLDSRGIIKRGLMIRHLVLPGHTGDSKMVLKWIAENLPHEVYVSLMSQYTPAHRVSRFPELNRVLSRREYDDVVNYMMSLGLENGYHQDLSSSGDNYTPSFDLEGV